MFEGHVHLLSNLEQLKRHAISRKGRQIHGVDSFVLFKRDFEMNRKMWENKIQILTDRFTKLSQVESINLLALYQLKN